MASSSADGSDADDGLMIDITIKTLDGQNRSFNVSKKVILFFKIWMLFIILWNTHRFCFGYFKIILHV